MKFENEKQMSIYCDDVLRYLGSRPFCLVVVLDSPVHFLSISISNQMKFNYLLTLPTSYGI